MGSERLEESTTSYVYYIDIYSGRNGNLQENPGSNVDIRCIQNSVLQTGVIMFIPIPVGINERCEMKFKQKGCLVASVWKDKNNVYMLPTIHDNATTKVQRIVNQDKIFSREPFPCPKSAKDYSTYMGGVDTTDQYIQYYCFKDKTNKWSKRIYLC